MSVEDEREQREKVVAKIKQFCKDWALTIETEDDLSKLVELVSTIEVDLKLSGETISTEGE